MCNLKRFALVAMCFVMVVSLAACGGGAKLNGKYVLIEMKGFDDADDQIEQMKKLGVEMYMEFNPDGTGVFNALIAENELKWDDKEIEMNGEKTPYKLSGNRLTIEKDGKGMVFEKAKDE